MSLCGRMLVGLTFTTEIFRASLSLACSCSCFSSSSANSAAQNQPSSRQHVRPCRRLCCDLLPSEVQTGSPPEAERSSSSVGDVPYTRGSTKGVKEALEPPPLPTPNCRAEQRLQADWFIWHGGKEDNQ